MADQDRPWLQQSGEPDDWFGRFVVFRDLGPGRSLNSAYGTRAAVEGRSGTHATRHWRAAAREWRWRERAAAWDADRDRRKVERQTARAEQHEAAADEWIDHELETRRATVARLRAVGEALMGKAATLLRADDDKALNYAREAREFLRLAQAESREEARVTDDVVARLLEQAKGAT